MSSGKLLKNACRVAIKAHDSQVRKNYPMPFISHPMEVMKRVFHYGVRDEEILAAAVLHDVIEDTNLIHKDLEKDFGKRVADIVDECSHPSRLSNKAKLIFMKSFHKKSYESTVIKVADRVCNVRDYYYNSEVKYASWYALQAYPLLEVVRYHMVNDNHLQLGCRHIVDDIGELTRTANLFYDTLNDKDKIDDILIKKFR